MQARPAPVLDLHAWHLTSFSQLAHGRHNERDHRDAVVEPEDAGAIGAVTDAMDADVPLATFARGTHAGNCLHQLLEQWDFHEDTAVLVDRGLRRHRLYSTESADAVRHTLAALKTTRLDGLDACLDTAASNKTLSEWEFLLPLGRAGITGRALSDLFARHARTADEHHYAQDLAGLPSQALAGMLTGYIDRLVRTDGRWGVVDWKSNYLGSRVADYSGQALWRCAGETALSTAAAFLSGGAAPLPAALRLRWDGRVGQPAVRTWCAPRDESGRARDHAVRTVAGRTRPSLCEP